MKNNLKENLILFKRITAIALSLFMVAGILLTPVSTKAGDGDVIRIISYIDEEFSFYQDTTKLESNKYLLAGTRFVGQKQNEDGTWSFDNESYIYDVKCRIHDEDSVSDGYQSLESSNDTYFVLPNLANDKYGSYIYITKSAEYKGMADGKYKWEILLDAYPGLDAAFYNQNLYNILSVYYYYDALDNTVKSNISDFSKLELTPNGDCGDLIGWSKSLDFYSNPDSWFGVNRTPYYPTHDELRSMTFNTWSKGHMELYPVYANVQTELSVSVENDGFIEGIGEEEEYRFPELDITSNRPDDLQDYKIEFFSVNGDEKVSLGEDIPYTAGNYIVEVSLEQTGTTSFNSDGELVSKGYSKALAATSFIIRPDSKITDNPAGNTLTYNGEEQPLVTAGEAFGGGFIYSMDPEGDFTPDIPTAKNAGGYTVWYMLKGTEGRSDIGPLSVEADISPKTVAFTWSDTVFKYDGKSHVPTATVTGLIEGDVCGATVDGGESKIGTYTAYVTALSNSNYMIPEESYTSFTIEEKPVAVIKEAPKALNPTYSNINQKLVSYGEVEHGTMLYSLTKDGEYSLSVPTGKDAGTYTVWYKVEGEDGWKDIAPVSISAQISPRATGISWSEEVFTYDAKPHCLKASAADILKGDICTVSVSGEAADAGKYYATADGLSNSNYVLSGSLKKEFTIAPKTVGLIWSDTKFVFDFEEHCPAVKLTGICEGDTCTVTVTGAGKEIGRYTATAKALSNSNYSLPTDVNKEFEIVKPDKKIGSATVSMKGYYYGGKASTPVVNSLTNKTSKVTYYYKHTHKPDSSYRAGFPTEVGEYTLKAVLPENDDYTACVATTDFTVSYLPVPEDAYTISGKKGTNGWYVSDVTITPATGYEISYGDRNHYSGNPIKLEDTVSVCYIFIKDILTGGQTSMISVGNFNIDSDAPDVIGMNLNGLYFADENGFVKVLIKDDNLSKVLVEGKEIALTKAENGSMSFSIKAGKKKEKTSFTVYDLAGNKTDFAVITAPHWAENGELIEGELYLEGGEMYTFPEGCWTVNGDDTRYFGGTTFYVVTEGDYILQKITD